MNRSEALAVIAIVVSVFSVIATFIGSAAGINANILAAQANATSKEANGIASASMYESSINAETDRHVQRAIAEMQQTAKRPALELLRFSRVSPTEFYATVQNSGERYAAMFDIICRTDIATGYRPSIPDTIATIPIKNTSEVIAIRFNHPEEAQHSFQPPSQLAPGEIVTFKLSVSEKYTTGEFLLFFNARDHIHLGQFESDAPVNFLPGAPIGDLN
jgi:hypothetical protein